jgi:tryptophan synthase alpha chain
MSRIASRFTQLRAEGRSALIPYVAAGDPAPVVTVPLMHAMVRGGADLIELGVPFSDPMADGPVIQRAAERALAHHVSLRQVLAMVGAFRQDDAATPVVLMGYLNPVEVMGYEAFARAAAEAGVDGVLTVDLPPEEAADLTAALRGHGLDPIFLVAPTSDDRRIHSICDAASGFVYYVSIKGVTGASHFELEPVERKVAEIRRATSLPVGVGFGIKDPATAKAVAAIADAVIVGSAVVSRIEGLADSPDAVVPALEAFIASLREAMDQ